MTTADAGPKLGVTKETVAGYILRGMLHATKKRGRWEITDRAIEAFKATYQGPPPHIRID